MARLSVVLLLEIDPRNGSESRKWFFPFWEFLGCDFGVCKILAAAVFDEMILIHRCLSATQIISFLPPYIPFSLLFFTGVVSMSGPLLLSPDIYAIDFPTSSQ